MVRRYLLILLLSLPGWLMAQNPVPPLGGWREHLPFSSIRDIAPYNSNIVAASPYSFFTYDPAASYIERFSRISGLSETGIQLICHVPAGNRLLVAYQNNNIDLLDEGSTRNIADIVNSNQLSAGGLLSAFPDNNRIYLSSSIGIIVLDAERAEVSETWRIGNTGQPVAVHAMTRYNTFFYAATEEGLKMAPANGVNLADFASWSLVSGTGILPSGAFQDVFLLNNTLIARSGSQYYQWQNNSWDLWYEDGFTSISATVSENRLSICQRNNDQYRVQVLQPDGSAFLTLGASSTLIKPQKAFWQSGILWIADSVSGLLRYQNGSFESVVPASPAFISRGQVLAGKQRVFTSRGAVSNNGIGSGYQGSWSLLDENGWRNFAAPDSCPDISSLAFDAVSGSVWAGSWGGGLLLWNNNQLVRVYKQGFLGADVLLTDQYRIGGLAAGPAQQLWIINTGSANPLVVRTSGDEWHRFSPPWPGLSPQMRSIIVDNNGNKLIAGGVSGLLCYREGNSLADAGDDMWRQLGFTAGAGNLPGTEVTCVEADRNGFIWVGTNNGIAVLECPEQLFNTPDCEAIRPVIQTGNFAGFLFNNERILCIATDGANRKWVGTEKGAWLVSEQGDAILQYWNTTNSPLTGNRVQAITIVPETGEVFFATDQGLCSWRGSATEPVEELNDIRIYPNPVPPGYTGQIGIRGLVADAIVKITELNGRLVYQARSQGGQVVWNGRDYQGRQISTGVYLVLVTGMDRKEKAAGKIVFINR